MDEKEFIEECADHAINAIDTAVRHLDESGWAPDEVLQVTGPVDALVLWTALNEACELRQQKMPDKVVHMPSIVIQSRDLK